MPSAATRFAVMDEKLSTIQKTLNKIEGNMEDHRLEHDAIQSFMSKQDLINKALYFVAGIIVSGIGALVFKVFFRGG